MTDEKRTMKRQERNFPSLDLSSTSMLNTNNNQPILVVQSPKTPTLSRKLKAVSLDSDPVKALEMKRDVSSMPNTPKRQLKQRQMECEENGHRAVSLGSNLKRFASNTSISGSQTLKTLPEVMTLQDFSDSKPEPVRIKAKGLLERRGSNASLTIDLGSNSSLSENRGNLNARTTKSASNLNLSSYSSDKCSCELQTVVKKNVHRDEGQTTRGSLCKNRCYTFHKKCNCLCNFKCRRKSLSNENLYVPPCSFCQMRSSRECGLGLRSCKGCRRAMYPRQPELEPTHILSEDFKLHLQNIQYLQTAGSILSVADLKSACEPLRVPKLHQEFWEVPLNLQEKCIVSGTQSKNRYKGVLPNEHSRVHLPSVAGYIHANYIKGPDYSETAYIATQGPMEHTCEDFWEMVWSSRCECIVMLTGLIEKGKSKCELYFPLGKPPSEGKSYLYVTTTRPREKFTFDVVRDETETIAFEEVDELRYGNYKIMFCKKESLGECVVREFRLSKGGVDVRKVVHYWFANWQDHKMANPQQVLEIALHILESAGASKRNNNVGKFSSRPVKVKESDGVVPIVVHCSAGIGRTGCFLAILNGIRQLRSNFNVDILAILCSLRLNRGGMVQTAEQYELIHRVLSLYSDRMPLC
ncbi:hypothetical protein PPYR_03230 [Photinus pyralis]|uniref:protein-tyrosine-phosphatase n=2 Tax=Photinus pyralis TaxID=7054 RepID=A0A5N4A277_PHOPY|nr:uncharacterized protein LOC116160985 [Photinus pyralis]KAB0791430.1 hypothetical protein PPYR_03230 [Photinus pyralis]